MLIAMLLLVLFLGIATYWVYRSAEKIVDQKTPAPVATPQPVTGQSPTATPATPVHQPASPDSNLP
jgi:hypothetical protein